MLQECAARLQECFLKQISLYKDLDRITRGLSGQIALSKGDFTQVLPTMEKKQELLAEIETLKEQANADITLWQEHKEEADSSVSDSLNATLESMQGTIKKFLISEKQLQKQLEFYRKG